MAIFHMSIVCLCDICNTKSPPHSESRNHLQYMHNYAYILTHAIFMGVNAFEE